MRRGETRNLRYGVASARVEAGVRDEPVTPLVQQRVDLEDFDFDIDHGHVGGVAQPQSKDSGTRYGAPAADALATQMSLSWVNRCSVSPRR
jgi:hypothetical protein